MIAQFGTQCLTKYSVEDAVGLIYSDSEYENINERKVGILPNSSLSSTLINTVLRQSTFAGIIIQNTIKAVVQKADTNWTNTRIEKALSCDKTSTETNYTYDKLINKFIAELEHIENIVSGSKRIDCCKQAKNYVSGGSIDTALNTTLPTKLANAETNINNKLTADFYNQYRSFKLRLTTSTNNIEATYVLDYYSLGTIQTRFDSIESAVKTLEGK